MIDTVKALLVRDLNKLKVELASYQHEHRIWQVDGAIANSAGNLCLHLVGNLNTYVGVALGTSDYVRDRPLEFSQKDVPRAELLRRIDATIAVVTTTLDALPASALHEDFPMLVFAEKTSTEFMLVHLATHLAYHLGQVNYHRRLLDHA